MTETYRPVPISRRQFLQLTGIGIGSALLAACAPIRPDGPPSAQPATPSVPEETDLSSASSGAGDELSRPPVSDTPDIQTDTHQPEPEVPSTQNTDAATGSSLPQVDYLQVSPDTCMEIPTALERTDTGKCYAMLDEPKNTFHCDIAPSQRIKEDGTIDLMIPPHTLGEASSTRRIENRQGSILFINESTTAQPLTISALTESNQKNVTQISFTCLDARSE